ncbi:MAG: hypothetical protein IT578_01740 [Verrucomicrobiae bacterium]|nr:hypothetical protein [Verrucomicrobiae bacterium]
MRLPAVPLACLLAVPTAFAHLDTLTQVLEPDPLVRSFEAETLPALGAARVIDDRAASGGKAVLLAGEGSGFRLELGRLPVGMHSVHVAARLGGPDPFVAGPGTREAVPLYLHLKVNSAPGGGAEEYRLRVPLPERGLYEHVARIYFHTPEERGYSAEIYLGPRGRIRELVVDRVELRNPLANFAFRALKNRRTLSTPEEIQQLRATAAKGGRVHAPVQSAPLSMEVRAARDRVIWNESLMPINANCGNYYLLDICAPKASDMLKQAISHQEKVLGKPLGNWVSAHGAVWDQPGTLTNRTLALGYTMADYRAGRPLPAPWPFPEDGGGFFYEKEKTGLEASFNYGILPRHIGSRYAAMMGALCGGDPEKPSLADRYLLYDDLGAAADAAFLLAAVAYRFPGYDYKLHAVENIYYPGRAFRAGEGGRGPAGQWSGPEYVRLCHAYDKLFPYIQGNAELAARLGRFIPWVRSPEDVIRLLDTFLVQRGAQDGVQHVFYAQTVVPVSAAVLGPNEVSTRILDGYFRRIYLRNTLCGFPDSVVGNYSRDGLNYIGSTYYAPFESKDELFEVADLLARHVSAGGDKRFDVVNPSRFPQLAAQAASILGLHVAGGHAAGVGDVGTPTLAPKLMYDPAWREYFLRSWEWTKDPRIAWVLANQMGQGACPDAEWQQIVKAAQAGRDPVRHAASRVLEGFGIAVLEEGSDAEDLRHKNAAMLRFGIGSGHAHPDTLDLEVYAHGFRMSSDLGGRHLGRYGHPSCMSSYVHNVVQVDEQDFSGGPQNTTALGWLDAFKPLPGAQYVLGGARAETHPQVSLYARGVLQVMCDPGNGRERTPSGYLFDVFRVRGGRTHTWCFHGCVSEEFTSNAGLAPATSGVAQRYLKEHLEGTAREGVAPEVLEATWKLRRKEEVVNGIKLGNAERAMSGKSYDPAAPEKFTKVHLLGHGGEKVMVANWYAKKMDSRFYNFPFLYVRRDGAEVSGSVYPSVIEPYAGQPFVTSVRQLKVENAGEGATRAVAIEVKTAFGQTDLLFSGPDRTKSAAIEGNARASGNLAFISRDARGLRLLGLVGGTEVSHSGISARLARAEYRSEIRATTDGGRIATLSDAWPARLLDGEILEVANPRHQTTRKAARINGTRLEFDRPSAVYQGGVGRLDAKEGFAELDVPPYLHSYHPEAYEGTTAVNEAGKAIGRVSVTLGDRFFYTGWPAARRHQNTLLQQDVTDANGDGKLTLAMIATEKQRKFAPDGKTLVEVQPGEKMLDLEVTRIREDGLMFFTRQHPREYLDASNDPHPGWPYHQQLVRNERGDREWTVDMPGDTYRLRVEGRKLQEADLPDSDGDGRRMVVFHDQGPGDRVSVAAHLFLRRLDARGPGVFELRANAACTLTLPGRQVEVSADEGATWKAASSVIDETGGITTSFTEEALANGRRLIRVR